jgi:hypothetical protein
VVYSWGYFVKKRRYKKMEKLWYNEKGSECCVFIPLQEWVDTAIDEKRNIHLVEACYDEYGRFFCMIYPEVKCSSECEHYEIYDSKSGECRHLIKSLKLTGNEILLNGFSEENKSNKKELKYESVIC